MGTAGKESCVVQASAVSIGGRAVLIEGPPGSGKSTLALALIDRGAGLIGDDGVTVTRKGGLLVASEPPNIAGLIEIRGVGIARLSTAAPAPLALILSIGGDPDMPPERLPTSAAMRDILGVGVPALAFEPGTIAPALRAEWALAIHGLA